MTVDVEPHLRKRLGNGMCASYRYSTWADWLELRDSIEHPMAPSDLPFYDRLDRRTGVLYDPDDGDRWFETEIPNFQTVEDQVVGPECVDGFCPAPPAHPVDGSTRELDETVAFLAETFDVGDGE